MKSREDQLEEWKPILNFEGFYEISNLGRVKSLSRKIYKRILPEIFLLPCLNKKGYLSVCLNKNGIHKVFPIHKLVGESFLGKRPFEFTIDHIDFNKQNNCSSNLRYLSNRDNRCRSIDKTRTSSRFIGVMKRKLPNNIVKWDSHITVKNKTFYLGRFHTETEAALAYQKAKITYGIAI